LSFQAGGLGTSAAVDDIQPVSLLQLDLLRGDGTLVGTLLTPAGSPARPLLLRPHRARVPRGRCWRRAPMRFASPAVPQSCRAREPYAGEISRSSRRALYSPAGQTKERIPWRRQQHPSSHLREKPVPDRTASSLRRVAEVVRDRPEPRQRLAGMQEGGRGLPVPVSMDNGPERRSHRLPASCHNHRARGPVEGRESVIPPRTSRSTRSSSLAMWMTWEVRAPPPAIPFRWR